jgi:ankyrin repeat protein
LLEHGVSLIQAPRKRHSPLCHACRHGLVEIVSLLLDSGAYLNENCEREGDTPLGVSCHHGQEEVVSLLLADSRSLRDLRTTPPTPCQCESGGPREVNRPTLGQPRWPSQPGEASIKQQGG